MIIPRLVLPLVCAALLSVPRISCAQSNEETAAQRSALDLAGAFSNDGFKLRDGRWIGQIQPGKPALIQVNLYAGNSYWFSTAAAGADAKMSVTIYNENGQPVKSDVYQDPARAAAGFTPSLSGPYYIKLEEISGPATSFCLIYSYK